MLKVLRWPSILVSVGMPRSIIEAREYINVSQSGTSASPGSRPPRPRRKPQCRLRAALPPACYPAHEMYPPHIRNPTPASRFTYVTCTLIALRPAAQQTAIHLIIEILSAVPAVNSDRDDGAVVDVDSTSFVRSRYPNSDLDANLTGFWSWILVMVTAVHGNSQFRMRHQSAASFSRKNSISDGEGRGYSREVIEVVKGE
ncbi:hypothetical protein EVAR_26672_1 [Eumeta japonica]|uniref:Uncharacterized protein n=1 Tax=Eumeta variegata TaxID=151549 RepID=A0A4C1VM55_EUMVA|nr:hypothetical protein EVAR_26672_1 [Eumeta japonica]